MFDYDWGMHDDLIGSAVLDLTDFELNKQVSAQSVICSTPAPSIVPVDNLTQITQIKYRIVKNESKNDPKMT